MVLKHSISSEIFKIKSKNQGSHENEDWYLEMLTRKKNFKNY